MIKVSHNGWASQRIILIFNRSSRTFVMHRRSLRHSSSPLSRVLHNFASQKSLLRSNENQIQFVARKMSTLLDLSRTLALIKPHAVRHRSAILRRVQMSGFRVLQVWAICQLKRSSVSKTWKLFRSGVSSWQSIKRWRSSDACCLHARRSLTLKF